MRCLTLGTYAGCADLDALTLLTSVHHLRLSDTFAPLFLYQLTWLRSLHVWTPPKPALRLPAALSCLRQLRALALCHAHPWNSVLVEALDRLPHLRHLLVRWCAEAEPPPILPAAAFWSRLHVLDLDWEAALHSPQALQTATQLRRLCILGTCEHHRSLTKQWRQLWGWAAALPSLQSMEPRPGYKRTGADMLPTPAAGVRNGLAALCARRPDVHTAVATSELFEFGFWRPFLFNAYI